MKILPNSSTTQNNQQSFGMQIRLKGIKPYEISKYIDSTRLKIEKNEIASIKKGTGDNAKEIYTYLEWDLNNPGMIKINSIVEGEKRPSLSFSTPPINFFNNLTEKLKTIGTIINKSSKQNKEAEDLIKDWVV